MGSRAKWKERLRYEMHYDLMLYWPDVRPCWLEGSRALRAALRSKCADAWRSAVSRVSGCSRLAQPWSRRRQRG